MRAVLVAAGAAVVLAGCTTRTTATPAPERRSPAVTEQPSAAPTAAPTAFARFAEPAPLVSRARARSLTSSPWKLLAVSADGRTLTLMADQGGGCDTPGGIEVVQTVEQVEVTSLSARGAPPPGGGCAAYLATPVWTVRLQQPLGARPLVHPPAEGSSL